MSEEILRALTQLFAIVIKQDAGATEPERAFIRNFFRQEVDQASVQKYLDLFDQMSGFGISPDADEKDVSVKDSLRTLTICKKINKTLSRRQKFIAVIRMLELMASDRLFTPKRLEFLHTVAIIFHISTEDQKLLEAFVMAQTPAELAYPRIVLAGRGAQRQEGSTVQNRFQSGNISGFLAFLHIPSVDGYFVRYQGDDKLLVNGQLMAAERVYTLTHGSTVKSAAGDSWYYSDLVAVFNHEVLKTTPLSFYASIREHHFPGGAVGLHQVEIAEGPGRLVGIMGASGAGKTTLMNILSGMEKPSDGEVYLNGFRLHDHPPELRGAVGFVAQDDFLIEELTVYQNLYYNSSLCLGDLNHQQLHERVLQVLQDLGLSHLCDLRVGSVLDKTLSGGQRKRLNIAMELIREPAVLFLDEPTSGLSSRDSENVVDLLKDLSLKGKLVFAVIHQPSSDIYKVFDRMLIMDVGGYEVYYGPPADAVEWFKRAALQVDPHPGQCETCGNVNPEQIFGILEADVVDEYGQPTGHRRTSPEEWNERYRLSSLPVIHEAVDTPPPAMLRLPGWLRQTRIFLTRDVLAKLTNRQYLLINLLEAPILALILAFVIRYPNTSHGTAYFFRFNENIPAFLLMAVIVALFMGLTGSAEEIIRDRKILKREAFLQLNRNSYLLSKIIILFAWSAVQTMLFVLVSHFILEIRGMTLAYWAVLFTVSCFASVLGLNISSAFRSAVTVYILIPLLIIPQMILSGLIFSYEKLHPAISQKGKVPIAADLMASRWAYEAMAVEQVRENEFSRDYLPYEESKADADYRSRWLADALRNKNHIIKKWLATRNDSLRQEAVVALSAIRYSLQREPYRRGLDRDFLKQLSDLSRCRPETSVRLDKYLDDMTDYYQDMYKEQAALLEKKMEFVRSKYDKDLLLEKNLHFNQELTDLTRNLQTREPVADLGDRLVRQASPVYWRPQPEYLFDYRAPFFSPYKNLAGGQVPTFWFNLLVLWFMSGLLYLALYKRWLMRIVNRLGDSVGQH